MESPPESGCLKHFTSFAWCQSPYAQFFHYYQHGSLTSCEFEKKLLKNCLKSKTAYGEALKQLEEERIELISERGKLPDCWASK